MSEIDSNELMAGGLRVIGAFQWCCRKGSAVAICTNAAENLMHFAARTRSEASAAADRERTNAEAASQGCQEGKQLRTKTGGCRLRKAIDAALDAIFQVEFCEVDEQSRYSNPIFLRFR